MLMLLSPISTNAAANISEDIHPDSTYVTTDIQLSGALRDMLLNMLSEMAKSDSEKSTNDSEKTTDILLQTKIITSIINGDRVFVSMGFSQDQSTSTPSIIVSLPITEDEWNTILENTDLGKKTYDAFDYYKTPTDTYFVKLETFLVIQPMGMGNEEEMQHIIDLADGKKTDSLSNNKEYMEMVESYLKSRSFGITLNVNAALKKLEATLGKNETSEKGKKAMDSVKNLYGLFQYIGGSIAEKNKTYSFNLKVKGNEEKLKESGISFNPGGTFTPNLYKKFPSLKTLFYTEIFNTKAAQENSEILTNKISDYYGEDFKKIQKNSGFDIKSIYKLFSKEVGIAIQYDEKSVLPYFTFMANVGTNMDEAKKTLDQLVENIEENLKNSKISKNTYNSVGLVTSHTFYEDVNQYVTTLTLNMNQSWGGNYLPSLPEISIIFRILPDGTLIASNYPGIIKDENLNGFELPITQEENSGLTYVNMRNIWNWSDNLLSWIGKNNQNALSLNFYQSYYGLIDKIYHWNDITFVEKNTETQSLLTGSLRTDEKKHSNFKDLLTDMKKKDQDGDGVSDYYENFVYHTPVNIKDTDEDGINDMDELKKGWNPKGPGKLFTDISEENYYTKDIALLKQSGIFQGYGDSTFHPQQSITRAEFIAAVVKAFDLSDSPKTTFSSNLKNNANISGAVSDVTDINEWYYTPMIAAYDAGLIRGNIDQETGAKKLRPFDRITRAEAITILSRASKSLKKAGEKIPTVSDEKPSMSFVDVKTSDWFYAPIARAYELGIVKGKTNQYFSPQDELNRADAAVLIRRTLEKDIEQNSDENTATEKMTKQLKEALLENLPL